eukprot:CAMPEP_0168495928 /NCGR_PEP_ID=MMETSP0228-20121227/71999_1 /TAXON_ID=133427 /ORGANISM="Protoceratium reticulatum, Strain CCCM 535 (=CCMP 1889)" /LENGTH=436 /DNA_ID=CAMNT_0008512781 /DNA_START=69 /DNA_END=1375 /DNA_ORIENTATION=+
MTAVRVVQAYLVAGSRMLCYMARAQLGALLPLLTVQLGLSKFDQGYLMSRYASGYLLTQVLGGICADRFGSYPVLALVLLMSGLCCLAAPMLAGVSTAAFGASLFVLGLCQGAAFPAGSVVCARWLLPEERSWASSISAIGAALGAFAVNASAAPLAGSSAACFAFMVLWLRLGASSPGTSRRVTVEETRALRDAGVLPALAADEGKARQPALRPIVPPRAFLGSRSIWVLFACHFSQNWQQYFGEWLPLFYSSWLGSSSELAGLHAASVGLAELPSRAVTARLPELLLSKDLTLLTCRKLMSVVGFAAHLLLSAVLAMMLLRPAAQPLAFTALFALSRASQSCHAGGYYANYLDLTRDYSGFLSGFGNTLATAAGVLFPRFASWSLDLTAGSWLPIISSLVLVDALAMSSIMSGMSVECLDEKLEQSRGDATKKT